MSVFVKQAPVSVVIPCFRCAKTIARAVESITRQSTRPAEVILVDDASGDGTLEVLRQLGQTHPDWVKLLTLEANQGSASARNAGWAIARQPYIAFLDADDSWHPQKIEIQYAYMAANPEVVLSGHAHRLLNKDEFEPNWSIGEYSVRNVSKNALLLSNRFVTPSVMLKREMSFRFSEGKRHMEDHLLWLEIACAQMKITRISAELAAIYKAPYGATGLSAQMWAMEMGELENYRHLYSNRCINILQLLALRTFSIAKFARRLARYWIYIR
jgi:glycosyltransferase involved in cell wall biosynthesis